MPRNRGGFAAKRGKNFTSGGSRSRNESPALNSFPRNIGEKDQYHPRTLQDEARNTQQTFHAWSTDTKLRNAAVKFVSSGLYTATDPLCSEADEDATPNASSKELDEPQASLKNLNIQDDVEDNVTRLQTPKTGSCPQWPDTSVIGSDELNHLSTSKPQDSSFVVDLIGDASLRGDRVSAYRSASPTPSNSSAEVVLFKGRKRCREHEIPTVPEPFVHKNSKEVSPSGQHWATPQRSTNGRSKEGLPQTVLEASSNQKHVPNLGQRHHSRNESDKGIIEDYIENLRASGELEDMLESEQMPARELDIHLTAPSPSPPPNSSDKPPAWTRSDLEDFDDLSTSYTCSESIYAILSKRKRPSGLQYLVVWAGYTVDDARWIPRSSLNSPNAEDLIALFEVEERQIPELAESESSSDGESEKLDVVPDDIVESEEDTDDKDLWQRRVDRLTDEKIARLLAKQEELGMGSEALKILDDSTEDIDTLKGRNKPSKRTRQSRKGKSTFGGWKGKGSLMGLDLDGMLEDSEDIDMMPFKSQTKQSKSRTFDEEFLISDSDLDMQIRSTWLKDREKKKVKKQEREKLRAQGLLGKKNGKPDLKAKYPEIIGPQEIVDEIIAFLNSNAQSLPLPPMGNAERKIAHEIARPFFLKSKSVGSGTNRFPVLYKTSRSEMCDGDKINSIVNGLQRRLPRLASRGRNGSAIPKRTGGGGGAGVHYRDGDVVGAAAPELGAENKGRAMLEKMGWSQGTALGALNNKGILQPVVHIVKTSKAGLR